MKNIKTYLASIVLLSFVVVVPAVFAAELIGTSSIDDPSGTGCLVVEVYQNEDGSTYSVTVGHGAWVILGNGDQSCLVGLMVGANNGSGNQTQGTLVSVINDIKSAIASGTTTTVNK